MKRSGLRMSSARAAAIVPMGTVVAEIVAAAATHEAVKAVAGVAVAAVVAVAAAVAARVMEAVVAVHATALLDTAARAGAMVAATAGTVTAADMARVVPARRASGVSRAVDSSKAVWGLCGPHTARSFGQPAPAVTRVPRSHETRSRHTHTHEC